MVCRRSKFCEGPATFLFFKMPPLAGAGFTVLRLLLACCSYSAIVRVFTTWFAVKIFDSLFLLYILDIRFADDCGPPSAELMISSIEGALDAAVAGGALAAAGLTALGAGGPLGLGGAGARAALGPPGGAGGARGGALAPPDGG